MTLHLIAAVSILGFGAKSDGTKCTEAFRNAIAACQAEGGGRVVVPPGRWFTGPVHLRSGIELHLEEGAVIEFSDDPADCLPPVMSSWEGLECMNYSPLVYAYGCTNVAITGKGTVRARMGNWARMMEEDKTDIQGARAILYRWGSEDYPVEKRIMPEAHAAVMRPQLIQFNRSKGIRLEGIRVEDSPFWTIHLFHSEDVVIRGVTVSAHGFNNDGVDIEMTRNVLIEDSVFDQGDDCFVFKAGRNRDAWRLNRPTENVEIRNCKVIKGGSLVGVGSELSGGIRNVYVHDCTVGEVARLFYVKTNHRRGGFVRNIRLENVHAGNVVEVMALQTWVLYQWKVFPDYETRITDIDGLYMKNVSCDAARIGIELIGDERRPVRNVRLENVRIGRTQDYFSMVSNVSDVVFSEVSGGTVGTVKTPWD